MTMKKYRVEVINHKTKENKVRFVDAENLQVAIVHARPIIWKKNLKRIEREIVIEQCPIGRKIGV